MKSKLADDALVSFMGMDLLGIDKKYASYDKPMALKDVYKNYTYFKEDDVLLAKITPCFENGKLGIAKTLSNGIGFGSSEFYVALNLSYQGTCITFFFSQALEKKGKRICQVPLDTNGLAKTT